MINIIIDPVIVMTPPDDATRDDVYIWLHNLSIWLNEALTAPFIWLHYKQASDLLEAYGRFPNFKELRRLVVQYKLDINPRQIARGVHDFFRNEELDITEYIECLDFIIEPVPASIFIQPNQFITRIPDYIQNDFSLLLAICCVCKHISSPFGEMLHIATAELLDNIRTVTISTLIQAVEPDSLYNDGGTITQTFPLIITPDDLPALNDIVDVWSQGEGSIMYALRQQLRKEATTAANKPFAFRLGPHFITSIDDRGLDTNEIVLRSIMRAAVNVIMNRAKDIKGYSLHSLRVSDAPDSPQRERASDKGQAWRLKLQQNGAGWRLHYWQIPTLEGPLIEFANVGKESEREIY